MRKKIKIYESQYRKLLENLNDNQFDGTPFNVMVNNSMDIDKYVTISNGGEHTGTVIKKDNNGVVIKHGNSKELYYINPESLKGTTLEIRRGIMNQNSLNDVNSWPSYKIFNIKDIVVSDDDNFIDSIVKHDDDEETDTDQDTDQDIDNKPPAEKFSIEMIQSVQKENRVDLKLSNGKFIELCCVDRAENDKMTEFVFSTPKTDITNLPNLYRYEFFTILLQEGQRSGYVTNNDDGTFNLILKASRPKVKNVNPTEYIKLENITQYNLSNNCDSSSVEPDETPTDGEKDETPTDGEKDGKTLKDLGYDAEEVYRRIVSDENMKAAFFSQPGFWQIFVDTLRGKKSVGKGVIVALDKLDRYAKRQLEKRIGTGFSKGNVIFDPLEDIVIEYTVDTAEDIENKKVDKTYKTPSRQFVLTHDLIKKKSGLIRNFSVGPNVLPITHETTIIDGNGKKLFLFILVKLKDKNKTNVEICDLVMGYDGQNPNKHPLGPINYNNRIKFFKSQGFNPPTEVNQPTEVNPPNKDNK